MSIERTLEFFKVAKPKPTSKDVMTQFGADTEECVELLEAFGFSKDSDSVISLGGISRWGYNAHGDNVDEINKEMALDALCDKMVTAIGLGYMMGMDIEGALKEVAASNLSKFYYLGNGGCDISDNEWMELSSLCRQIEGQGRYKGVGWKRVGDYAVFFDENGKILKNPKTYFEPDLKKYIKGE